jgi:ABC-2 type transport system ATP-binding protein
MTETRPIEPTALAVEARGLRKTFCGTCAVDGVDLAIPRGSIYGFLGPNGAGKTTTIRILATLLRPDGGTARVLGHDVVSEAAAVRCKISLTSQFASVDEDLTCLENLVLLARLLGRSWRDARARGRALLEEFGLADSADQSVARLSGGMRRRLDIAASLISTPEVLFLDEPTTGLDPRSRNRMWDVVRALAERGTTVLLTTQYLDEADQLADRIAVIDHGRVIAEGTRAELKASIGEGHLRVGLRDPEERARAERILEGALGVPVHGENGSAGRLSASLPSGDGGRDSVDRAEWALAQLHRSGVDISDFALAQPSLDEVFLALTGRRTEPEPEAEAAQPEAS